MALVAYIAATVLFLVAWLLGGIHSTAGDFALLALALFSFAHVLGPALLAWPPPPRQ